MTTWQWSGKLSSMLFILIILAGCGGPSTAELEATAVAQAAQATLEAQRREVAISQAVEATMQAVDHATATAEAQKEATAWTHAQATAQAKETQQMATVAAIAAAQRATDVAATDAALTTTAQVEATATALANSVQINMIRNWKAGSVMALSLDGKTLATGGTNDEVVRIWNMENASLITSLSPVDPSVRLKNGVTSLAWSPDGQRLAIGSQNQRLWIWRVGSDQLQKVEINDDFIYAVTWSPDGQVITVANGDDSIHLYSALDLALKQILRGHTDLFDASLAWSPDGQLLASNGGDGTKVWRIADGSLLQGLKDNNGGVMWGSDGKTLISGRVIWNPLDGTEIMRLKSDYHSSNSLWPEGARYSPDGKLLTDGTDIWRTSDGHFIKKIEHPYGYRAVQTSWSPDGKMLVNTYQDDTVWLWEVKQ